MAAAPEPQPAPVCAPTGQTGARLPRRGFGAARQSSTQSVAMPRAPDGPATVRRTGPCCTRSKLNRPKRSEVCSTWLSVPSSVTVAARAGTIWPTSRRCRGVDDHQLDLDVASAERELPGRIRVANPGELERRVEHEVR